ncbi:MAG: elongation factor P hydroxylase [Cellvibrionaceae bacterium]|nr:elongation factor P hydroxylase [Cellvibrionaceae bacterium]
MPFEVQNDKHFCCQRLVAAFGAELSLEYDTLLVAGGEEPIYLPAENKTPAKIIFREDFFASALHEVAHWCVAGARRRRLPDYGYWYCPDGRSAEEQARFEHVEIKPQALEWIFSSVCGYKFRISADNLMNGQGPSQQFKLQLVYQVWKYCESMPLRAEKFAQALAREFNRPMALHRERFCIGDLVEFNGIGNTLT